MTLPYIGTAAWTIPTPLKSYFSGEGTHLEKYALVLNGVEINSSFYKDHKPQTYERWSKSTPAHFRFSVKLSKYFTQEARLKDSGELLQNAIFTIQHLKKKLGPILIQLPPSLEFNSSHTTTFLKNLRRYFEGSVVWEPRHISWTSKKARYVLKDYKISKVDADPEPCPMPVLEREYLEDIKYYRLHGSPHIYKSRYPRKKLYEIQSEIALHPNRPTWCIFDNTTYGFATANALELKSLFQGESQHITL